MRLEQGRGLRPSADVVEALSRALRLAPDERAYLFGLAQQRPRTTDKPATTAAPSLVQLVTDLSPLPAMLMNHRYDILAWNGEMADVLLDFGTLPPSRRNAMWLCLMHPESASSTSTTNASYARESPTCAPPGPPTRKIRH